MLLIAIKSPVSSSINTFFSITMFSNICKLNEDGYHSFSCQPKNNSQILQCRIPDQYEGHNKEFEVHSIRTAANMYQIGIQECLKTYYMAREVANSCTELFCSPILVREHVIVEGELAKSHDIQKVYPGTYQDSNPCVLDFNDVGATVAFDDFKVNHHKYK